MARGVRGPALGIWMYILGYTEVRHGWAWEKLKFLTANNHCQIILIVDL